VSWLDSLIKSEAQHSKKDGLVVISKMDVFFYFFNEKKENKLEKEKR
jgi:hypothetical protein